MKKIFLLVSIILFSFGSLACNSEIPVKVDILAIGKADCILVRDGEHTVMIDTGEEENAEEILSFLSSCKISRIDCLILTHFDKDHAGGFSKITEGIEIGRVIHSEYPSEKPHYSIFQSEAKELGLTVEALHEVDSFTLGRMVFHLFPATDSYNKKQDNNSSIITALSANGKNLLFCADAEEERLNDFLSEHQNQYELIKLPHHGNYHNAVKDLLQLSQPSYAVITNSSKNPADEKTLKLLEDEGISTYETKNGTVSIQLYESRELYITQK